MTPPADAWQRLLPGERQIVLDKLRTLADAARQWAPRNTYGCPNPSDAIAFRCTGKAGQSVVVRSLRHCPFKPAELLALDDSTRPGRGARIMQAYGGTIPLADFGPTGVPIWMFAEWVPEQDRAALRALAAQCGTADETAESRAAFARLRVADAAGKMKWHTAIGGADLYLEFAFDEDCTVDGALWGMELR